MGSKGGWAWAAVLTLLLPTSATQAEKADDFLNAACEIARDKAFCEAEQKDFRASYERAMKRDYQAQRNVAYCILTGCGGAVTQNQILGCAWRTVIVYSGSLKVDASDSANLEFCLKQMKPHEIVGASNQAETLYKAIYEQPIPQKRKR